jgi:hypothetical protein
MSRKTLAGVLFFVLVLGTVVFAQEQDVDSAVENKINKMQRVLDLSDIQAIGIKPVIKEYLIRRQTVLNDAEGQGIVDHVAIQDTLKALKQNEYQKLGKVLTQEQLKKWIDKENLMAALNPDSAESSVEDDVSLTANGANFKF